MRSVFLVVVIALLISTSQQKDFQEQFFQHLFTENYLQSVDGSNLCDKCKVKVQEFQNQDQEKILNFARFFVDLLCPKIETKNVCLGIKESYVDTFVMHYLNRILMPQNACADFGLCQFDFVKANFEDFLMDVLKDQLDEQQKKEWTETALSKIVNKKDFKILQLADLHIDLEYAEGYNAFCDEPHCCREENGLPSKPEQAAQFWGTQSHCDIPLRTLEKMIEYIENNLDIDMIIWTGDSTSHDVWHQSQDTQTKPTRIITDILRKKFPNMTMYPIFGNHEQFPADQFDFSPNDTTQWLKNQVADIWQGILGEDEIASLRKYGYYSSFNPEYNIRFIAMNTQASDTLNFYLLENPTDPSSQIIWLSKQLQEAEDNHEFAYIFAHIPPGDFSFESQWSKRYAVIIERFQHVIKAQLFGHTHNDHIQFINSQVDQRPLSHVYIAPSGTTYSYQNPSFRIFDVNSQNNIMDYHQYRLDLNKANQEGPKASLQWERIYSFISEYGLKSTDLNDVHEIISILERDQKKLEKYISHYFAGSDELTAQEIKKLNSLIFKTATKEYYVCGIKSGIFEDYYNCVGTLEVLKENSFILYKFIEMLSGPWRSPVTISSKQLELDH